MASRILARTPPQLYCLCKGVVAADCPRWEKEQIVCTHGVYTNKAGRVYIGPKIGRSGVMVAEDAIESVRRVLGTFGLFAWTRESAVSSAWQDVCCKWWLIDRYCYLGLLDYVCGVGRGEVSSWIFYLLLFGGFILWNCSFLFNSLWDQKCIFKSVIESGKGLYVLLYILLFNFSKWLKMYDLY